MKRVAIHLTQRQIEGLKKLTARTGLSKAELIRRAIDEYLRVDWLKASEIVADKILVEEIRCE